MNEDIDKALRSLASEASRSAKAKLSDPGPQFWYALLGAYVQRTGEVIDGVPTVHIDMKDILALQNRVVCVADDRDSPGSFIISIRKND